MANELEPGTILRDKYRIERVIGRGGMGCVVAAWHLDLEKRVAIKVLLSELREHGELVERFLREARAASRLEGDHVARILDVDRLADGTPFIVMEYLEGHDLSQARRTRSPCAIRDAVEYVIQACEALGQAHSRGIVHRDIKPANLFLAKSPDGTVVVKVLDFGISKMSGALGGSEPNMTKTSVVMGSAEYMSPEQMLSARDVDGRTDIWALGVVLFEILTATPPFVGETLPQVCALVLSKPPPRPRSLRPDLPEVLEQTILRCLQKDRDDRFATAEDLALALEGCLSSTSLGLGPASVVASTSPVPALPIVVPLPSPGQGTLALPATPVPSAPRMTSGGTSISRPPQPARQAESQPPLPPDAVSEPALSGSPTHTPVSSDPRGPTPSARPSRATLILAAVLGCAVASVAIGVGVRAATRTPARSSFAPSTPSPAPEPPEPTRVVPLAQDPVAPALASSAGGASSSSAAAGGSTLATPPSASTRVAIEGPDAGPKPALGQPSTKPPITPKPAVSARPVTTSGID